MAIEAALEGTGFLSLAASYVASVWLVAPRGSPPAPGSMLLSHLQLHTDGPSESASSCRGWCYAERIDDQSSYEMARTCPQRILPYTSADCNRMSAPHHTARAGGASSARGAGELRSTFPPNRSTQRLPTSARRAVPIIRYAGEAARPVSRISVVAASGAVPLNIVKLTLKTSATPVKRIRVGKRSVSSTANEPFVRPAQRPARMHSERQVGRPRLERAVERQREHHQQSDAGAEQVARGDAVADPARDQDAEGRGDHANRLREHRLARVVLQHRRQIRRQVREEQPVEAARARQQRAADQHVAGVGPQQLAERLARRQALHARELGDSSSDRRSQKLSTPPRPPRTNAMRQP